MKAWRVASHGGVEVLKREEVATPEPQAMQARIRVEAVGLNHLDLWVRKGVPGHKFPLPITVGCDVTGVIEKLGPGAESAGMPVGTPVIVNPGYSCGSCDKCQAGQDPLCKDYGIVGEHFDGGCSDFFCAPMSNVIARPAALSAAQAAALGVPFITAWSMITEKARVTAGQAVLVHAGGSGVSIAAIQMAKHAGAHVITTAGSAEKAQKALTLGADHAILYRDASGMRDWRAECKPLLAKWGKKGFDVVIDHVGVDTFGESMKSLTWGGKLVTCGATTGADVTVDLKAVFFKNLSILGSTMGGKALLPKLADLVARGELRAIIDSEFAMSDLPKAHARLESRAAFGKIVVRN